MRSRSARAGRGCHGRYGLTRSPQGDSDRGDGDDDADDDDDPALVVDRHCRLHETRCGVERPRRARGGSHRRQQVDAAEELIEEERNDRAGEQRWDQRRRVFDQDEQRQQKCHGGTDTSAQLVLYERGDERERDQHHDDGVVELHRHRAGDEQRIVERIVDAVIAEQAGDTDQMRDDGHPSADGEAGEQRRADAAAGDAAAQQELFEGHERLRKAPARRGITALDRQTGRNGHDRRGDDQRPARGIVAAVEDRGQLGIEIGEHLGQHRRPGDPAQRQGQPLRDHAPRGGHHVEREPDHGDEDRRDVGDGVEDVDGAVAIAPRALFAVLELVANVANGTAGHDGAGALDEVRIGERALPAKSHAFFAEVVLGDASILLGIRYDRTERAFGDRARGIDGDVVAGAVLALMNDRRRPAGGIQADADRFIVHLRMTEADQDLRVVELAVDAHARFGGPAGDIETVLRGDGSCAGGALLRAETDLPRRAGAETREEKCKQHVSGDADGDEQQRAAAAHDDASFDASASATAAQLWSASAPRA